MFTSRLMSVLRGGASFEDIYSMSFDGTDDSLAGDFAGHVLDDPSGQNVTIFTVVKPKGGLYILSSGGQTSHARGYALSYQSGNSFSIFLYNINYIPTSKSHMPRIKQ